MVPCTIDGGKRREGGKGKPSMVMQRGREGRIIYFHLLSRMRENTPLLETGWKGPLPPTEKGQPFSGLSFANERNLFKLSCRGGERKKREDHVP